MRGDFTGFSFNGFHTEGLGLVRVSNGDRYDDHIFPDIEDKTVEIPGNDGQYYFGSNFKQKTFSIEVAFDKLTEEKFRKIRTIFSTKKMVPLIFDEEPYKIYYGKVQDSPEFHYICFDQDLTEEEKNDIIEKGGKVEWIEEITKSEFYPVLYQGYTPTFDEESATQEGYKLDYKKERTQSLKKRFYKGEASFTFICYFPFAKTVNKFLDSYKNATVGKAVVGEATIGEEKSVANIFQWEEASGLLKSKSSGKYHEQFEDIEVEVDKLESGGEDSKFFYTYNAGDIPSPPLIYIPFNGDSLEELNIGITEDVIPSSIETKAIQKKGVDQGILINCQNHLIEGATNNGKILTTKNIYNEYIKVGDFFKIPPSKEKDFCSLLYIRGSGAAHLTDENTKLLYDYYYL